MSTLKMIISEYTHELQHYLFPMLEERFNAPLSEKEQKLITILDMLSIEKYIFDYRGYVGRPPKNRGAVARSFVAKAIYNIPDTKSLIDRLKSDKNLRKICGFETAQSIPAESSFSRAFDEFAKTQLPQKTHEAIITKLYAHEIVGHVSKDSTAIPVREKPERKEKVIEPKKSTMPSRKKKAANGCAVLTRIKKQAAGLMSLEEMIKDLPTQCNFGLKKSSSGHKYAWIGYKLHLAVDDNSVPLAAMISSASMNDSQAAIPLAIITSKRVVSFYDLMDSGYYAGAISKHSRSLGHVPIIDRAAKGDAQKKAKELEKLARKKLNWQPPERIRYRIRSSVERANARLKDEFGGFSVRVKGAVKVFAHLMYGILAQTADQLLKLVT